MEGFVMWSIVQCKEASIRVSIASFFLGPKEAAVEAPPELVDSENPRQFVPFTYEDYRKLRLSINLHAGEALQFVRSHSWSTGMPCISTAFIRILLLTQLWWSISLDIKQISQFLFFIIVNCDWCIIKVMLMVLPFYTKIISH